MNSQNLAYLQGAATRMLHASWQGALLAVVVLAISLIGGRRLDPRFRFLLWLVVFVRLALPGLPEASWSIFGWFSRGSWEFASVAGGPSGQADIAPNREPSPTVRPRAGSTQGEQAQASTASTPSLDAPAVSLAAVAISVWLLGAVVMIVRLLLGAIRLHNAKRGWCAPIDTVVSAMFEDCRQQLGIRRKVSLWVSRDNLGPATLGCLRTSVVIPHELPETIASDDLRLVLMHELIHVRRRDVPIDRLACLIAAIHWPNPLAWIALSCLRRSRELSCDVALLDRVGAGQARHYGHLILSTVETLAGRGFQPAAIGILGHGQGFSLRQRIRAIAEYRKPNRPLALLTSGLVLLVALVGLTDAQHTTPKHVDLEYLLQTFHTRESNIRSFEMQWVEKVVARKGDGTQEQYLRDWRVVAEGDKFRTEERGTPGSGFVGNPKSVSLVCAYDAKVGKRLTSADAGHPLGTISKENLAEPMNSALLYPVMLALRPYKVLISKRNNSSTPWQMRTGQLDGQPAIVLSRKTDLVAINGEKTDLVPLNDELYVDPSTFTIKRAILAGGTVTQWDIEYRPEETERGALAGWRWKCAEREKILWARTARSVVTKINPDLAPAEFELTFPVGTLVTETQTNEMYIIGPDRQKRSFTTEDLQRGATYEQIFRGLPK